MSNNTNKESMATSPPGEETLPKGRKVAAKKTAAKKAPAKKVAKKTAARKSAKNADAGRETPELPFGAPEPTPAKQPRPKRTAPAAAEETNSSAPHPTAAEGGRRFGRVPGGGPVAQREQDDDRSPEIPAAPEPQAPRADHPPQGERFSQDSPPQESRSKRRREKRKRRRDQGQGHQGGRNFRAAPHAQEGRGGPVDRDPPQESQDRRPVLLQGPKMATSGMLEMAPKGFGFIRIPDKNFEQARDDVFVTPETIRRHNLRVGQWIRGLYQEGPRGPQLVEVESINDMTPEEAAKLPHFDELKAINPTRRISFETTPDRYTTRVIDIMAPVGRGQRGLIVSPPRSGKTTLLLHMAEAIREKYDEAIHLMVVLVDERPEEVTEFRRTLPGAEIYASSNDEQARNHTRIAELAIERAKRLVEAGKDVFLLMDSITRLARAYNSGMNNRGRGTGSGGITIGALEIPRRLFAAARNTRGGGSLTILATALIQTNSRADEAIFMEFKGTGNMELVLDRKIAENYIYPAVDIFKSGTRREELLLADHMLHKIHLIRRGLSGHRPAEAMERLLFFLKKFPNNPQMLMEIKG